MNLLNYLDILILTQTKLSMAQNIMSQFYMKLSERSKSLFIKKRKKNHLPINYLILTQYIHSNERKRIRNQKYSHNHPLSL